MYRESGRTCADEVQVGLANGKSKEDAKMAILFCWCVGDTDPAVGLHEFCSSCIYKNSGWTCAVVDDEVKTD